MTRSGAERMFDNVIGFLRAGTWSESRRILTAHPELLNSAAEFIMSTIVNDPLMASLVYPGMDDRRAAGLLRMHEALLARCREVGISRAFTEMTSGL